jgi:nucleotide-binding universal stress UspA family protein
MAKRILVPLDQSEAAETVVPLVRDLARGAGATVRLLHVAPVPHALWDKRGRVVVYVDQEVQRLEVEALDYLRAVEAGLDGIPVEIAVRFGDPAAEILREVEAWDADLLALTTRSRSALGRTVFGSVAESVFRKAAISVLLLHPGTQSLAA